ncbi:MAG: DUF2283 domain-containing protein [Candidatus Omnitrophica bacterium]|nr:DUF2283 domain-containing protein [Candidatus Omnitrophota bacterium]MBU1523051.1 DUF2283 domain-containing protein [Candidatus Omnitrophota bacterium]MBU2437322.1 DUF2283 domain-containing protein [Candidatus Omnitrophota bacterium]
MKTKYFSEDDLLVIKLSELPYEYAEKIGMFIVHYTKQKEPISLEILNASKFFKEAAESFPYSLREKIISSR